ncbi:MAG TPA: hypothetical protein VE955_00355, partial [Candidatus Dormibacteraeota bacterium]|nr:hypothetical protein [Candidatus Dormibacteraeota bacterium]
MTRRSGIRRTRIESLRRYGYKDNWKILNSLDARPNGCLTMPNEASITPALGLSLIPPFYNPLGKVLGCQGRKGFRRITN